MEVRIEVDNAEGRLKPGMFADVEIVTMIQQDALLIPDTALQTEGEDKSSLLRSMRADLKSGS